MSEALITAALAVFDRALEDAKSHKASGLTGSGVELPVRATAKWSKQGFYAFWISVPHFTKAEAAEFKERLLAHANVTVSQECDFKSSDPKAFFRGRVGA